MESNDTPMRRDAQALFDTWAEALLALRVRGTGHPTLDGALLCPACCLCHGRAIDAVWPFAWAWARTGDGRFLDAAKGLVTWGRNTLERPGGGYLSDMNGGWRGTTIFAQTALGKALLAFGDRLDPATLAEWRGVFDRQTRWIHAWMDNPQLVVNVNYRGGFALAMEIAYAIDGDPAHRASGDREARRVMGCIGADGLLWGEAKPLEAFSRRGYHGVDFGYNMEETLPAMLEWAERRGDPDALARLVACGAAHLDLVLPDGGIDNSFGSRAYKWTWWGGRTSDGCIPLYAALARHGVAGAARACELTLGIYRRATDSRSGLLSGGLDYEAAGEPPCSHHAFCTIKTLPEFLDNPPPPAAGALLAERPFGLKRFSSIEAAIAGVGPWRASASANDMYFVDDNGKSTGGGSLTLLHHREAGPVFAASMAEWSIVEFPNMQEQLHDDTIRCLTPRLESPDGRHKSVYDDQVAFDASPCEGGGVRFSAHGKLRDRGEDIDAHVGPFSLEWTIGEDRVTAAAVAGREAVFHVPVLARPEDKVEVRGALATIAKRAGTLSLRANRDFSRVRTKRADNLAFSPQTGLLSAYLTLPVVPGCRTFLEIRWERA